MPWAEKTPRSRRLGSDGDDRVLLNERPWELLPRQAPPCLFVRIVVANLFNGEDAVQPARNGTPFKKLRFNGAAAPHHYRVPWEDPLTIYWNDEAENKRSLRTKEHTTAIKSSAGSLGWMAFRQTLATTMVWVIDLFLFLTST